MTLDGYINELKTAIVLKCISFKIFYYFLYDWKVFSSAKDSWDLKIINEFQIIKPS